MKLSRLPLLPLHLAQVATGAKSFEKNLVLGNGWANRKGLHVARVRYAQQMAARRRVSLAKTISVENREALDRDGYVKIADF